MSFGGNGYASTERHLYLRRGLPEWGVLPRSDRRGGTSVMRRSLPGAMPVGCSHNEGAAMDDPQPTLVPRRRYHPQIVELLAFLETIVVDGLQHGFFKCSLKGEIGNGRRRNLLIRAGKFHKFTIPEDHLPR